MQFDAKEFESMFAKREAPKAEEPSAADGKAAEAKDAKPRQIELIEQKRSYNINIAMARFKMTNAAVRDALLAMDDSVLNPDKMSMWCSVGVHRGYVEPWLSRFYQLWF